MMMWKWQEVGRTAAIQGQRETVAADGTLANEFKNSSHIKNIPSWQLLFGVRFVPFRPC
jgi:hypothetical protein